MKLQKRHHHTNEKSFNLRRIISTIFSSQVFPKSSFSTVSFIMPFSPSAPSFSDFGLEFRPLQCHFNSSSICRKCSYSYQKERKNATTINRTRNETPSQICLLDTSGILPELFRIACSMKKVSALQNLIMKLFISNRIEFYQCCQLKK